MAKRAPLIYFYLQAKLAEDRDLDNYISITEAKQVLLKHRLPMVLHFPILREMQSYNLLEVQKKNKCILIGDPKVKIIYRDKSKSGSRSVLGFEL